MHHCSEERIANVGVCEDLSIHELAELVARVVGYSGTIAFDKSRPDGAPRKLLDVSRLANAGWLAKIPLAEDITATYRAFVDSGTDVLTETV